MSKFRGIVNGFTGGEIAPSAFGRTDISSYKYSCKLLRNMLPRVAGGAFRRPGTKNVDTKTLPVRVIPFIYSNSESYAVCLGDNPGTLSGGTLVRNSADTNIFIYRKSASSVAALDIIPTIVTSTVTGYHLLSSFVSFESISVGPPGLTIPLYGSIFEAQYTQSADVMWIVHPSNRPKKLIRTALDTFKLADFDTDSSGVTLTGADLRDAWPYRPVNTGPITLKPSATSGNVVITAANGGPFSSYHIGSVWKVNDNGTYACFRISSYNSSNSVNADVIVDFGTTTPRATWWEPAWSGYRGFPRTVGFYRQRLVYGGNSANPTSLWFSEDSDYGQMSHSTHLDPRTVPVGINAFTIDMYGGQLNNIQWLVPEKTLLVGTETDETVIDMRSNQVTTGFGADNYFVQVQSRYGSDYITPVRAGAEIIFASLNQSNLRSLVFDNVQQSYNGEPLQSLYDEFPKHEYASFAYFRRIRTMTWDAQRSTLWINDTAGNLRSLTRDKVLKVNAWSSHEMGGYSESTQRTYTQLLAEWGGFSVPYEPAYYTPSGSVISIAVVPDPLKKTSDVWLSTMRYVNGSWQCHIEYIDGDNNYTDSIYDSYYKNDGTYYLDNYNLYTALTHLNGETVSVVHKGTHGITSESSKVVSSGTVSVTVPSGTEKTLAGYAFSSILSPVRPDLGSQIGTAQGAIKRIHEVNLRFYKTITCKIGRDSSNLETINFRTSSTLMSKSAQFFSSDKRVKVDSDYDRDGYLYILADNPLPMNVISISYEGVTSDG